MSILITKNWRDQKPCPCSQLNRGHPLSQGLVGCWLMDEGAGGIVRDLAKNHDGTISGASWLVTRRGLGLSFDGSNDYAQVPKWLTTTQPFWSASAWVYFNTASNDDYIFRYGDINTLGFILIRDDVGASSGRTDCFTVAVYASDSNKRIESATNSALAGRWYHVCFTLNEVTDILRLYINGVEDANSPSTTVTNFMGVPLTNLFIGASTATPATTMLNGIIENAMMWDRELSFSEIRSLYEAPYQFIQPIRRRIFSIPSAPPVTDEEEYDFMEYNKYW